MELFESRGIPGFYSVLRMWCFQTSATFFQTWCFIFQTSSSIFQTWVPKSQTELPHETNGDTSFTATPTKQQLVEEFECFLTIKLAALFARYKEWLTCFENVVFSDVNHVFSDVMLHFSDVLSHFSDVSAKKSDWASTYQLTARKPTAR